MSAREIGRPLTPPLPARVPSKTTVLTADGQDGRTDGQNVSKTHSVKTCIDALIAAIQSGASVSATYRKTDSGEAFIFSVQRAGAPSPDERFATCLTWMREHQTTNRKAFFAGCPDAGKNCALHHKCIRQLRREGAIERVGREYVFKD